ncbi:Phytoene dehydrogenase-related protein [Streptomyces sp. DvalAA-14]|uniref:phytoene desaturase family protein n=1 Tax=unclassified Streptomyces TaxID=2593676 RepID=UPI00081AF8D6|nr:MULTISPECIES: NAD(P)/FAD-dependent oxidoreductase [unclassified Streptomyces]MYS24641.1 NAD(P)-binding protein [Streptomyces sp. SID4948]SCE48003.1 Phytoene dehydrogenase-related protein [Streptomyces sp. DvalAA-14]
MPPVTHASYDAVIVGGGHNGLVAAAYLARAGRRVLLLERLPATGGAAVSTRAFTGVDARLSRYSYLVSLLPRKIVDDLGLRFAVRRRRISSYSPRGDGGLLVDAEDAGRTREQFIRLTGSDRDFAAWQRFYGMTRRVAERVFPTLTGQLPTRAELERLIDDPAAWEALFERPIGETVEREFGDDLVRGVVLTDALIGTFSHAHDPSLRQNRCFLYHVIGGGTGDWDVPVGGMGALTDALADAARAAGAEIVTGAEVTSIATDGVRAEVGYGEDGRTVGARHVLVNAAPYVLAGLLGQRPPPRPEGAQLKVNMLLRRLPRLRDASVDPREAFGGTFHIGESYRELQTAYEQAAAGRLPDAPPSEIYCHSLTDPSILSPELAASGTHTLTLFGLHTPARLFEQDPAGAKEALLAATLARLDAVLAEPIADCLATDADGRPCLEAKSPLDLEREVGLPGGHIFHRDLSWPYATDGTGTTDATDGADGTGTTGGTGPAAPDVTRATGRWGVGTGYANVYLCGAGAVRGGGVSGVPGHNAAMAVLEKE